MYYAKFVRFFGGIGTHPQNENWKNGRFPLEKGTFSHPSPIFHPFEGRKLYCEKSY